MYDYIYIYFYVIYRGKQYRESKPVQPVTQPARLRAMQVWALRVRAQVAPLKTIQSTSA